MINKKYILECSIAILDFLNEKELLTTSQGIHIFTPKQTIMYNLLLKHRFSLMEFTEYVNKVRGINQLNILNDLFAPDKLKQFYTQLIRELKIELYEME